MNENTIGKRIQALRKERGMTQKQLADAVGVTPQAVSKWETDESCPDITALPLLAGTLGVSVDTLLSGAESASGPVLEGVVRDAGEVKTADKKEKPLTWNWNVGKIGGLIFGIFILLAGVLLILIKTKPELFGDVGFWDLIWPSAIICAGLTGCFGRDISGFSLGVVAVGVLFLLKNVGVIEGSVWPIAIAIVLILVGVTTILRQFFKKKKKVVDQNGNTVYVDGKNGKFKSDYNEDGGYIKYNASFGDDNVRFSSDKFSGGEVNVSFGDFDVDLTGVRDIESGAELKANISFGDLTIHVPKSVRVELETAGSFSGKGVKGNPAPDAANVLRVKAAASFADFEIEYED